MKLATTKYSRQFQVPGQGQPCGGASSAGLVQDRVVVLDRPALDEPTVLIQHLTEGLVLAQRLLAQRRHRILSPHFQVQARSDAWT